MDMRRYYTGKRIAQMIRNNVDALHAERITFEQFDIVQRATWALAGSTVVGKDRRHTNVLKALNQ